MASTAWVVASLSATTDLSSSAATKASPPKHRALSPEADPHKVVELPPVTSSHLFDAPAYDSRSSAKQIPSGKTTLPSPCKTSASMASLWAASISTRRPCCPDPKPVPVRSAKWVARRTALLSTGGTSLEEST